MKRLFFVLTFLCNNIVGMEQGCSNGVENYVELRNDLGINNKLETQQALYQGVPGVYYYPNGLMPQPFKDTSKETVENTPAIVEAQAKIKQYLKTTDIKSILNYRDLLVGKLYSEPVKEHTDIVAQVDEIDYQLKTNLASLLRYYTEYEAKRLHGDWIALNQREAQLEALLKNHELSDADRFKLMQERDIITKILNSPSSQKLMAIAEGNPNAAFNAWHIIQQQYKDRQIGNKTFRAAKSLYLKRKDVLDLENALQPIGTLTQSVDTNENTIKTDSPSEIIQSDTSISDELKDTTDLVTTTPTDADLVQKYLNKQINDRDALFKHFQGMLQEAAQNEGVITATRYAYFTKGFLLSGVDFAGNLVKGIAHPEQFAAHMAQGIVQLADAVGPFMLDVCSAPDGEFVTAQEVQEYQKRLAARAESMSKTYSEFSKWFGALTDEQKGYFIGQIAWPFIAQQYGPGIVGNAVESGACFVGTALEGSPFVQGLNAQAALSGGGAITIGESTAATAEAIAEIAAEVGNIAEQATKVATAGTILKQDNENIKSGGDNQLVYESKVKYAQKNKNGRTFVEIEHPVFDSVRSGSALKSDPYHAFDKIIDNFVRDATKFEIKGGDGIFRELYQIGGALNGESGIFEWIVDPRPEKGVTHRLFIKGGSITGKPNMILRR